MTCWSLPSARPIAFNDCPAFHRLHISARWAEESFHRLACIMNTTFRGETYIRWCCIDQLNRHAISETGFFNLSRKAVHFRELSLSKKTTLYSIRATIRTFTLVLRLA